MKILLAHNLFHITGGTEIFFLEVGRILESRGHEVAYFSTQDELNPSTPWSPYFVEPASYTEGGLLRRIIRFGKMVYSLKAKSKFARLLQDFQPDIVHIFAIYVKLTPSILDACRERKIPVIMSSNEYKLICPNYKLFHHRHLCEECKNGRFYRAIVNRCCKDSIVFSVASSIEAYVHNILNIYRKNIHTFLFASEFMARKFEEFWGTNTFRWSLLRNPFNSPAQPLCDEVDNYFLFFGRLIEEKGVDVLIKAMRSVTKANLVIVGDGPQQEELEKLTSHLQLKNVEFVGPKWGEDMNKLLQRARFVVVPSIWHENFPYVILQAFSFGKAIIGSNLGGIPELVQHEKHGLIYSAQDSDALASCIDRLWQGPEFALQMGRNAKEYVDKEFNDERFYANLMDIYKEVLE